MNVYLLRCTTRRRTSLLRRYPFFALAFLCLAARAPAATAAEPAPARQSAKPDAEDPAANNDDVVSLAAYNVKADRIEDFGFRTDARKADENPAVATKHPNLVTLWFTTFAPMVTEVRPNTAAAKAGLRPGDRILKSEGQPTVGGPFSTGKFGQWSKTQKKKWAEVAAGKTNVTWTLEVETPGTKGVRTVKMVVPTPPPRWGASTWRAPEGRKSSAIIEAGPLAERSRTILGNGIWMLLDQPFASVVQPAASAETAPVTAYMWRLGNWREGMHQMLVTEAGGRTVVFLHAASSLTGHRVYLTSPSGVLEKAWHFTRKRKGEAPVDEARVGFGHELDLWMTKIDKVSPRWPLELKPGYDANTIFAVLAAKDGATAAAAPTARPLAAEFLKLPSATEAQRALFADAYGKLGVEPDRWAYTETSRGIDDKRVIVTRVDPSKPEAERCTLLSIDGKPPASADVERWRAEGGDTPKPLGDIPPLASVVDLKDLRIHAEETASIVFELPLRSESAEFSAEKFQALFRANKTQRAFEEVTVKLRDSFRVGGVVKITEAGLHARFQTLDPAHPPQPVHLKGGGTARIVLVKIARDFEATRTDFKRVEPYVEPDPAEPVAAPAVHPVPQPR
jgi:hypothetical protein